MNNNINNSNKINWYPVQITTKKIYTDGYHVYKTNDTVYVAKIEQINNNFKNWYFVYNVTRNNIKLVYVKRIQEFAKTIRREGKAIAIHNNKFDSELNFNLKTHWKIDYLPKLLKAKNKITA